MGGIRSLNMTYRWDKQVKPIPSLQWLVVIVLATHILISSPGPFGLGPRALYVLLLLGGNVALLYGLPRFIPLSALATALVLTDTVLVPATLYATGTTRTDLYIVYFGIILIAGAAGSLQRAIALAAIVCVAYGGFALWNDEEPAPLLETILMRWPFFLVVTLFYGVMADFARQERAEKGKVPAAATHDELTGMPNKQLWLEGLARELERAEHFHRSVSCAVIGFDRFDSVAATYGQDMRESVLQDFSSLLALQTAGYELIGRLQGDEFAWVLPEAARDGCVEAADTLREAVEGNQFGSGHSVFQMTVSIGLTTYTPGESARPTPAALVQTAQAALARAKSQGGNRIHHVPLSGGSATVVPQEAAPDSASL